MIPLAILGGGLAIAGAFKSFQGASQANAAQKAIIGYEQQIEAQKMKAMELDAKRRSMSDLRDQQRAQALGLTAATNQGAQSAGVAGSGYYGGQAQIEGQSNVNLQGIQQNLGIGRNIFALNSQISQQKMNLADAQTKISMGSGLSSLGGSLLGGMEKFDNIFKSFTQGGGQGSQNSNFSGYNGYGGLY